MKNKINIDDLVRSHLDEGKEAHNLGAWANMERMLDGKNPYGDDSSNKKNRLLPLLLLLLIGSSVAGGSYYLWSQNQKGSEAPQTSLASSALEEDAFYAEEERANSFQEDESQFANNTSSASDERSLASVEVESKSNYFTQTSNEVMRNGQAQDNWSNTANTKMNDQPSNTSDDDYHDYSYIDETVEVLPESNAMESAKTEEPSSQKATNQEVGNKTSERTSPKNAMAKTAAKRTESLESPAGPNIPPSNEALTNLKDKVAKMNAPVIPLAQKKFDEEKFEVAKVPVNINKISQKASKDQFTTLDSSNQLAYKEVLVPKKQRALPPRNPRLVELTAEQEIAVAKRTAIKVENNSEALALNKKLAQPTTSNEKQTASKAHSLTKSTSVKKKRDENAFKVAFQKLSTATIKFRDKQIPIYPGMTVGINAALLNNNQNFGGFHGGLSAMTPLNNYLSFMTEMRFIYKNNSGLTINDIYKTRATYNVDNTTIPGSNIHNYQFDSTIVGYNFPNFSTLEVPLMLNAHVKNFNFYGGPNFAYGFKMNVTKKTTKYVTSLSQVVPYDQEDSYVVKTDETPLYSNQDFRSRLGLGYTLGAGYNFNPNLYIDFRMSNVLWDNMKTTSAQNISNSFFKVPSFQFSLGYRFRKFERDSEF